MKFSISEDQRNQRLKNLALFFFCKYDISSKKKRMEPLISLIHADGGERIALLIIGHNAAPWRRGEMIGGSDSTLESIFISADQRNQFTRLSRVPFQGA